MKTFLTRKDLATRWGMSVSTINKYAATKPHLLPPCTQVCGQYRYALSDVISFEQNSRGNNDPF